MINYYLPPAPSSTPWAPAWSPHGDQIAVGMSGSIWSISLADGVATELTYDSRYHSSPSWSPDGRWIVYTADDGGRSIRLEVLDRVAGKTHVLTSDDALYTDPVFSPDGRRIAYVATKPAGHFNVFTRALCEGNWCGPEIQITNDNKSFDQRPYYGEYDMHTQPAWTADGTQLLLLSNKDVLIGSGDVHKVSADGAATTSPQRILVEQTLYRTRPHVSPDGSRFVYSSTGNATEQYHNLYVRPLSGGPPFKLTFFAHDAFHPRWSPDGEWIAYIDNRGGVGQLGLLEVNGGHNRIVHISKRVWKRPVGVLKLVAEAQDRSGATNARIHLKASDGKFYAPATAYARIAGSSGAPFFHSEGESVLELPAGTVDLEAVKGFEYWPERRQVRIEAGQTSSVSVQFRRLTSMAEKGWVSGSTHVHMNYGGNLHNTPANMISMAAAEDLAIVNLLSASKDSIVFDRDLFRPSKRIHEASTGDHLIVVGQEYRPGFHGHLAFLGLTEHLLLPHTASDLGTALDSLYPSNTDMLRKARAQGAIGGYTHAFQTHGWTYAPEFDPLERDLGPARTFIVDAALGTADVIEWSQAGGSAFHPWYAVLNNGLKVAAVGGEDSISDLHQGKTIGAVRTYVHTGANGLNADAWLAGIKAGNSFVTTGPLLEVSVNGAIAGQTIALEQPGTVEVKLTVTSSTPLTKVSIVRSGETVAEVPLQNHRASTRLQRSVRMDRSGWIHVIAEGSPQNSAPFDTTYPQAFTNPIWIEVAGQPVRSEKSAQYCLAWLDKLERMVGDWRSWRSDREKRHVHSQLGEARQIYQRLLGEARQQANQRSAQVVRE